MDPDLNSRATSIAFSPDSRYIACAFHRDDPVSYSRIGVYDLHSGKEHRVLDWVVGDRIEHLLITPDNTRLIFWQHIPGDGEGGHSEILLWNFKAEKELKPLGSQKGFDLSASISLDGKHLATGDQNGSIRVWDLSSNKESRVLRHPGVILALRFLSSDELLSVAADQDFRLRSEARKWDIQKGLELDRASHIPGVPRDVLITPQGIWIYTTGRECHYLWDFNGKKQVMILPGHQYDFVWRVFSSDGRYSVQMNFSTGLEILHLKDRMPVAKISPPQFAHAVKPADNAPNFTISALSPDGKWLAGGFIYRAASTLHLLEPHSGKMEFSIDNCGGYGMRFSLRSCSKSRLIHNK